MLAASIVAAIARIALGAVLLVSAVAKIAAGADWPRRAAALGVPRLVAAGLPWLELVLGAAVVSGVGAPWPVAAAIALVGAFTLWIAANLARGERPPCACFGALSAAPLSGWDVARNGVLLALGVIALS